MSATTLTAPAADTASATTRGDDAAELRDQIALAVAAAANEPGW
jgi:hypothetical protein